MIDLEALGHVDRVILPFNGSPECVLLAAACSDICDRLTLVVVNTTEAVPEALGYIRSFGSKFRLVEVQTERALETWRKFGIPAEVVTFDPSRHQFVQPWSNCCSVIRLKPLLRFLREQDGTVAVINPERHRGQFGGVAIQRDVSERIEVLTPLSGMSVEEMQKEIAERGLAIPQWIADLRDPLACQECPARLTPARFAYLWEHHRQVAARVRAGAHIATTVAAAVISDISKTIGLMPGRIIPEEKPSND